MWKKLRTRFLRKGPVALMACLAYGFGGMVLADSPPNGGGGGFADELGPASIPVATGTDIVAAGTGLLSQPGTISITVPGNASVQQALLYWVGRNWSATDVPAVDTISVNGSPVTGDRIGGYLAQEGTYRADITYLGLMPGANTLTVSGLDFEVNDGAGVLVIIDDQSEAAQFALRDGMDAVYINDFPPRDTSVPQTFTFAAASVQRTATLSMFFSSVSGTASGGGFRPTSIVVSIPGEATQYFDNVLNSNDGEEWDTLNLAVNIPADATTLTVQALSEDRLGIGGVPASFFWLAAGLSVPPGPGAALGNCVWEDLDNDGIQAGDGQGCVLGSDSEPPVPNVTVNLLVGDTCEADPNGRMTTTDANGFYLFDNLEPGTYCVEFEKPSDLCENGEPVFTEPNQGNDALDSDADPATGITGPVTLAAGEINLTVDAGLFCPSIDLEKFTNGYDADNTNGFPVETPPNGGFVVGGNQVPLVGIGDAVSWTFRVTNTSTVILTNIEVTDFRLGDQVGVPVTCPKTSLNPGESMDCVAMGEGLDLANTAGTVLGCDAEGQGTPVPTYENVGEVTALTPLGVEVSDVDLSHYCNPPDIMVEKFTNGHDGDDANGIPDSGTGSFIPGAPTVAEVPSGDTIDWTYKVTNNGDEALENVVVTDTKGVVVVCPQNTLAPGETIDCTATATADDLTLTGGDVPGCDAFGAGETRPTYENLGQVTANGATSGVLVEDDDPSHYCNPVPPDCGLTVEKACEVVTPRPDTFTCDDKVDAISMILSEGLGDVISVTAYLGDTSKPTNPNVKIVGNEVTVTGYQVLGAPNDVVWQFLTTAGGFQSEFHLSCSDDEMDGETDDPVFPQDCGRPQGNGKDNSSGDNVWLLEGMATDKGFVLDCTVDAPSVSSCEFQGVAADCDFPVKDPDVLTFRISGGDCSASDNLQKPDKTVCTGDSINPNQAVQVSVNGEPTFTLQPGETFDVERGGDPEIELFQGNASQFNKFHASCSQPLQAGDRYGANELLRLDGAGLGTDVVYSYLIGNTGTETITGITAVDDPLGPVGSIDSLAPNASETLSATTFLTETTINTVMVTGDVPSGAACEAMASSSVTVLPPPDCKASIAFKELKDDAIKWTLTNESTERKATMETFTLVFPTAYGLIKEVKLDGAAFKASDSSTYPNGVPSGQTIGPDDWTQDEPAKRQLDQGESRTLEVKFTQQSKDFNASDFDLSVTFKEGCMVTF